MDFVGPLVGFVVSGLLAFFSTVSSTLVPVVHIPCSVILLSDLSGIEHNLVAFSLFVSPVSLVWWPDLLRSILVLIVYFVPLISIVRKALFRNIYI